MWRAAICISAALLLGFPRLSHAQYYDTDRQNPKEYTDEDSQPLALLADVLYPIGFAAEWLVARPLHYISHDSPVSRVFRPVDGVDSRPPPPVPIIPDNTLSSSSTRSSKNLDWQPTKTPLTSQTGQPTNSPATPGYGAPTTGSQPTYH